MSWSLEELTRHETKKLSQLALTLCLYELAVVTFPQQLINSLLYFVFFAGEISADRPESVTH